MKVTIFGTGYVGLVQGAVLADVGHDVICVDVDAAKVAALQAGRIPIHEPGLEAMVRRNIQFSPVSSCTRIKTRHTLYAGLPRTFFIFVSAVYTSSSCFCTRRAVEAFLAIAVV